MTKSSKLQCKCIFNGMMDMQTRVLFGIQRPRFFLDALVILLRILLVDNTGMLSLLTQVSKSKPKPNMDDVAFVPNVLWPDRKCRR